MPGEGDPFGKSEGTEDRTRLGKEMGICLATKKAS